MEHPKAELSTPHVGKSEVKSGLSGFVGESMIDSWLMMASDDFKMILKCMYTILVCLLGFLKVSAVWLLQKRPC